MGKTILITGSSSGIGKATVELFAKKGWNVAATMRDTAKSPFHQQKNIKTYKLDVTDTKSINDAFADVIKDFGGIDVVVNNAGYGLDGVFEFIDDAMIFKQYDTNVFGLMRVTRAAIKHMRPKKSGTIIQISSMGGRVTFPLYSMYHSTKWAVEGFSESLQYELNQFGIKIKIVEPGVIKTEFYGASRVFAKPNKKLGYDDFVNQTETVAMESGKNGNSPSIVADTILKAATSKSKKVRYSSGRPAPQLLFLRKLLPERLFYAIVRRSYKI